MRQVDVIAEMSKKRMGKSEVDKRLEKGTCIVRKV